jgi:hypothetical protein
LVPRILSEVGFTSNYITRISTDVNSRIWTTSQIPSLPTSQITGLDTALSGKQATINSVANQIIIGNGNGSTTTSPGLTFNTSTNTLTTSNIAIQGDLTVANNLTVYGNTTRLETYIYTTENLEVVNTNINSVALQVQQSNSGTNDIFVASNQTTRVFNIANNGDVNIIGSYKKNNRDVIQDTSNYIVSTSNILVNRINSSAFWTANTGDATKIYYNSGNVGIGTTNPRAKLDITTPVNTATETNLLNFSDINNFGISATSITISNRGNTLDFLARDYNSGGTITTRNVLSLRPEGNVGIGTTNPSSILQVGEQGGRLRLSNGASDYTLIGTQDVNSATNTGILIYGNTYAAGYAGIIEYLATSTGYHRFFTNGYNERMRITSAGNVGIATTNPLNILQVGGSGRLRIANNNTDFTMIGSADVDGSTNTTIVLSGTDRTSYNGQIDYVARSTGSHIFYTTASATERMRITSTGNVGIGTNNPLSVLHLHNNATIQDVRIILSDNTSTASSTRGLHLIKWSDNQSYLWNYENTALIFGTNNVERIRIASTGNVGIGTNNPLNILQVGGGGRLRIANDNTDYTLIGTADTNDSTNSTISLSGSGRTGINGTIDYVARSTGVHRFYTTSSTTERMRIASNGAVGIQTIGEGITNNYLSAGALTIGNTTQDYGGGITSWNSNTAGFLMECLNNTEIAVHDSGNSIHSFMRYTNNGNFRIGRDMGHGVANTTIAGTLTCDGTSTLTGRLGIGKAPHATYACDVNGTINATSVLVGGTAIISSQWVGTTNIYNTSGNVGIGTSTTPINLLELTKSTYTGALLSLDVGTIDNATGDMARAIGKPLLKLGRTFYSSTAGDYYGIGFGYAPLALSNSCCEIGVLITSKTGAETGDIVLSTRPGTTDVPATERMRITSTGNVGIGTNNPLNILHVGGTGQRLKIANSSTDNTMIGTDETEGTNTRINIFGATHAAAPGQISYVAKSTGNHIFFTTNSDTERMRIASGGNVGIGTNNPLALLDVVYSPPAVANTDMLNIRVDGNWGLKVQQSFTVAGNIQYNLIHRYNTVDYNSLTFKGPFIGVGTNNPSNKLHIVHSSTAANADTAGGIGLYVYNPTNTAENNSVIINRIAGSAAGKVLYGFDVNAAYGYSIYMLGSSSDLRFNNNWDGGGTDVMRLSNTGNLGIGTSPHATYKLNVSGSINATSLFVNGTAFTGSSQWVGTTNIYNTSGNVGIGTSTNINNKLIVHQGTSGTGATCFPLKISAGAYTSAGNGTATLIGLATQNDEFFNVYKCAIGHCRTESYDRGSIVFLCNNTGDGTSVSMSDERMRITSTGNVGIGNIAPLGPLHIGNASIANSDGFLVLGKNGPNPSSRQYKIGITDTYEFAIGNFGINNVAGTWVQQFKIANDAPVNSAIIDGTGGLSVFGNITAYYSDERLKTKTADISDPLKIIDKLNGFYYKPNELAHSFGIANSNKQEIGLSAQEVQKVLPELVNIAPFDIEKDKDGNNISKTGDNYLTLAYDRLAPVFVEAIKELNQKNISLTKENNELKEKYNKLLEDITLIKQTLHL